MPVVVSSNLTAPTRIINYLRCVFRDPAFVSLPVRIERRRAFTSLNGHRIFRVLPIGQFVSSDKLAFAARCGFPFGMSLLQNDATPRCL